MSIDRRIFLTGTLALGAAACLPPGRSPLTEIAADLRRIEAEADATMGAALYDTQSGVSVGINEDRRFGHASSFKLSLAAMVLALDAAGRIDSGRRVTWSEAELMWVSPFTRERLAEGATLRELARATQITSDNAAANVLLRELGGPAALTAFWRSIGDEVSRLDRTEPAMNNVPPTEFRDTTTPAAMARTVANIIYGDVLPEAERAELKGWMIATETGLRRVRAGLPEGWVAGDKTGTSGLVGAEGNYIDIGFVEPPEGRAPITFAAYVRVRGPEETMQARAETALARVGKAIRAFAERDEGLPLVGRLY